MIYVTGDTHIPLDIKKLEEKYFPEQRDMTKNDYLIICGDFGGIWGNGRGDNFYLNKLENKNFTTLWVDGNHENFDLLKRYKVTKWMGGNVQFIKPSIIHLMRGQVYTIEDKKFFTFGGGNSIDKSMRESGRTWWAEEMPNKKEYEEGLKNLKLHDYKIDYIISHTAPYSINKNIFKKGLKDEYKLNKYLEKIEKTCEYKKHYFGHFHEDMDIDDKRIALYKRILPIL